VIQKVRNFSCNWILGSDEKDKDLKNITQRINTDIHQPFVEINNQISNLPDQKSLINLKVPFPTIRVIPADDRKLFKTPQKQLMSPVHDIK